jgi:hypothetical protein
MCQYLNRIFWEIGGHIDSILENQTGGSVQEGMKGKREIIFKSGTHELRKNIWRNC